MDADAAPAARRQQRQILAEDDSIASGPNSQTSDGRQLPDAPTPPTGGPAPAQWPVPSPAPSPAPSPTQWPGQSPAPGAWPPPYGTPTRWQTPYATPAPGQSPWAPQPAPQHPGITAASVSIGPTPGLLWGSIWTRFAAIVIDLVLVAGSLFVVGIMITALSAGSSSDNSNSAGTALAIIWLILALIYHPACWYAFGASVGQKVLGLRLARASDGRALGLGAILARYAIFFVVTLIFPLAIISAIMAARDPFRRAWQDQVSRSIVVRNA
ncbi:MAG TPA: RDD family protein [Candidatus Limnocylindrales bacterium]